MNDPEFAQEQETPRQRRLPPGPQGLYDPRYERDACGMGFVVHIKGEPSHAIVGQGLTILRHLNHRGAQGSETNTGDGAGMMVQIPHEFLARVAPAAGINLPPAGHYGVGTVFLDHIPRSRKAAQAAFNTIVAANGLYCLGWRRVPADNRTLGATARAGEPAIFQVFIGGRQPEDDPLVFERKLYLIRRQAEKEIGAWPSQPTFYVASLSGRTLVYKGMLLGDQLGDYFPDLSAPDFRSAIALVHARFSTNTFPNWERAHPYRYVIHNGEINTLRGNVNWMRARQAQMDTDLFGDKLARLLPIIDETGSDTGMFDNVLEFLTLTGRSLPHAVMMMIPEPWSQHESMPPAKRAFYEYHSTLMEPWDGPAAMGFSDGTCVGAVLDRNGLRPSRYYVTSDDLVIMASEVGVLDVPPERVVAKGRLEPGRMFLVDTAAGRIVADEELKMGMAAAHPYADWLADNLVPLAELPAAGDDVPLPPLDLNPMQRAFGYTFEDLRVLLAPMALNGIEALGSMGNDTPPAVLSDRPQLLFDYFKQLFAQVTNPPLDAIREALITGTETLLGSECNLLDTTPCPCPRIKLDRPVLRNVELARLRRVAQPDFKVATLTACFPAGGDGAALAAAMDELCAAADAAIADGHNLLILSDRAVNQARSAIPALMAVAGLHHHLIRGGKRTRVSLIVESAEPREVHHFATLLGYGADAINPYLALATIGDMIDSNLLQDIDHGTAAKQYLQAVMKGVVKILSKMGISTIQSYRGAQIFEALGLNKAVVDAYFSGTASRIEGASLDVVAREAAARHCLGFPERAVNGDSLAVGGRYQWRQDGERHLFNPITVHRLQHAVRTGSYEAYEKYAADVNDKMKQLCTLRGLLRINELPQPLPLDEIESAESILRRFKTGAMSYGSISQEAHESLAIAMNRLGGSSNSGEGGEDPARFQPMANGDSRNSAIKQVASGRFGVTSEYLIHARELQIKMAQGAKPGEGGQLPGHKVYPWIARVRNSTPGVGLISPPPHHDIYSIEDLAQLIFDLKNANPRARINVKLVSEVGVGTIAAGVAKGHADVILISGYDGGTGASPQTSIKHAGLPWELGLAEAHQTLLLNGLRSRVTLETDGQLKTGRDVIIAALLGAEEFGFATAPLVALGCIMMRVCHLDTCPVGIATQNPQLRKQFSGQPEHVMNFMQFIVEDVRRWMARIGVRTFNELIGRTDLLRTQPAIDHWKAAGVDLSPILFQPDVPPETGRFKQIPQQHGLEETLDRRVLLDLCRPVLEKGRKVRATLPISNVNRTVGTILGSEITRRFGRAGLPEDHVQLHFQGSAGQSFGAFIPRGLSLHLEGDANDYLGKGLSGGKIVVFPPQRAGFIPEANIIIGNVAFYGATSGEAYIRGMAGERFAVRNSGAELVVEAVGDHGCEYMTGGRVVVLGRTGRNFAAGMSGGVAYVLDVDGTFAGRCNQEMVRLCRLSDPAEINAVKDMIWRHVGHTNSAYAGDILSRWGELVDCFVKVLPRDYEQMQQAIDRARLTGLDDDAAQLAAFEAVRKH